MKVRNITGRKIVISEIGIEMQPDQIVAIREDGKHKVNGVDTRDVDIALHYAEGDKPMLEVVEAAKVSKSEELLESVVKEIALVRTVCSEMIQTMNQLVTAFNNLANKE
jgi:hypothetical protein